MTELKKFGWLRFKSLREERVNGVLDLSQFDSVHGASLGAIGSSSAGDLLSEVVIRDVVTSRLDGVEGLLGASVSRNVSLGHYVLPLGGGLRCHVDVPLRGERKPRGGHGRLGRHSLLRMQGLPWLA